MNGLAAGISFVGTLLGALFLIDRFAQRIYDYHVTPTGLVVLLFGRFTVYQIPRTDILSVDLWHVTKPNLSSTFSTLRLGNRIVAKPVIIERRGGFPRFVIITPDDAQTTILLLRDDVPYAEPR